MIIRRINRGISYLGPQEFFIECKSKKEFYQYLLNNEGDYDLQLWARGGEGRCLKKARRRSEFMKMVDARLFKECTRKSYFEKFI